MRIHRTVPAVVDGRKDCGQDLPSSRIGYGVPVYFADLEKAAELTEIWIVKMFDNYDEEEGVLSLSRTTVLHIIREHVARLREACDTAHTNRLARPAGIIWLACWTPSQYVAVQPISAQAQRNLGSQTAENSEGKKGKFWDFLRGSKDFGVRSQDYRRYLHGRFY